MGWAVTHEVSIETKEEGKEIMNVIEPSISLEHPVDGLEVLKHIERAGRTCYKSEDKITDGSAEKFVKMILKSGHHSVLEHYNISVRVICDRGISHEIVRHRIASYSQESTRYCNYTKERHGGGELNIIEPPFDHMESKDDWEYVVSVIQAYYNKMIERKEKPQIARSILPNCLKTELVMTMNLREWRHFLTLRMSHKAHPQIRVIAGMIYKEFVGLMPVVFEDLEVPQKVPVNA